MVKAIWHHTIIAESNKCIKSEGNFYFPPDSVNKKHLKKSFTQSTCPLKGQAYYFNIIVNGEELKDAAWTYKEPKEDTKQIKGYIAFWKEVKIIEN